MTGGKETRHYVVEAQCQKELGSGLNIANIATG
jgi:hypothetical protein